MTIERRKESGKSENDRYTSASMPNPRPAPAGAKFLVGVLSKIKKRRAEAPRFIFIVVARRARSYQSTYQDTWDQADLR